MQLCSYLLGYSNLQILQVDTNDGSQKAFKSYSGLTTSGYSWQLDIASNGSALYASAFSSCKLLCFY